MDDPLCRVSAQCRASPGGCLPGALGGGILESRSQSSQRQEAGDFGTCQARTTFSTREARERRRRARASPSARELDVPGAFSLCPQLCRLRACASVEMSFCQEQRPRPTEVETEAFFLSPLPQPYSSQLHLWRISRRHLHGKPQRSRNLARQPGGLNARAGPFQALWKASPPSAERPRLGPTPGERRVRWSITVWEMRLLGVLAAGHATAARI